MKNLAIMIPCNKHGSRYTQQKADFEKKGFARYHK